MAPKIANREKYVQLKPTIMKNEAKNSFAGSSNISIKKIWTKKPVVTK